MIVRPSGLVVSDRRLLVMHYRYGGRDRFNLPGGKVDPGESLSDCLVREFAEELDLEVHPGDQVFTVETHAGGREVLHLIFDISDYAGLPCLNPHHTKSLDVLWMDVETLATAPLYPAIGPVLAAWMTSKKGHPVYLGLWEQPWIS